ncbi:MAG: ATP-binding protein [Chloroflexota bacterium]
MTKILFVDDLEQNRYLLRTLLAASGYEVLEAANGVEALDLARRVRPDLILSDILMSQMDGFTLCRECKRDEGLRDIPFVFYTATYTDPRDEELALGLGAARYIAKPIENSEFLSILREVLQAHPGGQLPPGVPTLEEETVFYRLYNEALVRKLEDKMIQLEQTNRSLSENRELFRHLASSVAHELRNPLGVIVNAVYYLQSILQSIVPGKENKEKRENVREYLMILETESRTAANIISNLLNFSEPPCPDRQPVSVPELVQRVLGRCPVPAGVTVSLNLPGDLPPIYADPRQVEQILGNLVVNACQAMPQGGQLLVLSRVEGSVFSEQCSVDSDPSTAPSTSQWVRISVQDTGVGILPENLDKIFEPLFTTKIKGIGLGLAVSRKLAEANGGRIEVQSASSPQGEAGKGTVFTLALPAYKEST